MKNSFKNDDYAIFENDSNTIRFATRADVNWVNIQLENEEFDGKKETSTTLDNDQLNVLYEFLKKKLGK